MKVLICTYCFPTAIKDLDAAMTGNLTCVTFNKVISTFCI